LPDSAPYYCRLARTWRGCCQDHRGGGHLVITFRQAKLDADRVAERRSDQFEPARLRVFLDYYVDGFFNLCAALAEHNAGVAMF
jgi:hypothetical protein